MPINSLEDLYQTKLQLILDAEQQALQAYPQILQEIQHDDLRQSVQRHMQQTQQQVNQVQKLVQKNRQGAQHQTSMSMQALIQETRQMLGQIQDPDTRDAFLIGATQAMEHHEIADYGTARAWAEQLGRDEDVQVLEDILDQEEEADEQLTRIAESRVNQEAARGDREVPLNAQRDRGAQGARTGSQSSSQTGSQTRDTNSPRAPGA